MPRSHTATARQPRASLNTEIPEVIKAILFISKAAAPSLKNEQILSGHCLFQHDGSEQIGSVRMSRQIESKACPG